MRMVDEDILLRFIPLFLPCFPGMELRLVGKYLYLLRHSPVPNFSNVNSYSNRIFSSNNFHYIYQCSVLLCSHIFQVWNWVVEAHSSKPSTQEAEAGEFLWVWGKPDLQELVPGQGPKLQRNTASNKQTNKPKIQVGLIPTTIWV